MDIIPDGRPIEEPEASAETAYQTIPAPLGQFLGEQVGSTIKQIGRVADQGQFLGSGWFPQMLYRFSHLSDAEAEMGGVSNAPAAGSVPTPMLSPAEYNARYAPIGPDGKPASLGSEPLPEGVAKLVGDAKREEIERANVMGRYENAHSGLTNFGAGAIGFMLDPLRASTAFIPGLGEEAIAARLGGGLLGRVGGRLGAGAVGGALSQAPISALEYGLGQQEASDYGLRDAFRDLAFAAAGNAIFHAGITGPITDILRRAPELPAHAPEAEPILRADAQTQHAAISSAVAELADGRPVDVQPMFQLRTPEPIEGLQFAEPPPRPLRASDVGPPIPSEIIAQQRELHSDGFAPGVPAPELRETTAEIYEPERIANELGVPPVTPGEPAAATPTVPEPQEPRGAEAGIEVREVDPEIAAAQQRLEQIGQSLSPEDHVEIEQMRGAVAAAEAKTAAFDEAAACLKEAGL